MKKFLMITLCFSMFAVLVSCGGKSSKVEETVTDQHEDEHGKAETATLTNEQMKTIGVELGVIEDKELTSSLKTNGVLRVPNQNKASVNSVYSGVVKSLLVQPGSKVSRVDSM